MTSKKRLKPKSLVSICIPVFNEEACIKPLLIRLDKLRNALSKNYELEYIFTDNASKDNTWKLLQLYKSKYPEIRAFRFSKNIGFQKSILFNYQQARGDAVIQLDADLQDPPELIVEFLKHWSDGYKVVTGIRIERPESKFTKFFRNFGYWLIDLASEYPIKRNAGDFRLLDRQIVDTIVKLKSPKPYLRGSISRMGVLEKDISYARSARQQGKSKFGFRELVKLGLSGLANHSNIYTRLGNIVGSLALLMSLTGAIYVVYLRIFQPNLPRGYASIYILMLFGIGVNAILLSIVGSFVRKIYEIISEENPILVVDTVS